MPNVLRSAMGPIVALAFLTPLLLTAQESERVTESLEGVSVTLPANEADLAEPMLKLVKAWREAIERGTLSKPFRGYLEDPKAAENSQRRVADHLGIEGGVNEAICRDWDEAVRLAEKAMESWDAWQGGFDTMHFWTKAEAEAFRQRERLVFQDSQVQVRGDGAGFRIRPSFLAEPIDLEAIPGAEEVKAHRLDFVLAYPIGATRGAIVRQYNDLLNTAVGDPQKGLVATAAADIYEAMYRQVFEKALKRRLITDDKGEFFRRAISSAFNAARNDQVDLKRGRKMLFGQRIRNIANQEWQEPIDVLAERMRKAPAWPSDSDGPAEEAVREVALAMVFLSLKNGGASIDAWLQAQAGPLDADAFSARLAKASSDEGWEPVFHEYCQSLAEQFEAAFADPTGAEEAPFLSAVEQQWPSALSGPVEVVHPAGMEDAARLAAEKVDAILRGFSEGNPSSDPSPPFDEEHIDWLGEYGLRMPERSPGKWRSVLERMARGGLSKLVVRVWSQADAVKTLRRGLAIPGMTLDTESGEVTVTMGLNWQEVYRLPDEDGQKSVGNETIEAPSYLIVALPADQFGLSTPALAEAIAEQCREHLDDLLRTAGGKVAGGKEEIFFTMASMVAGEALLRDVIASKDCEWFVMGLSHWLAIRLTDAQFGDGAGRRVFERRWPPQKNRAARAAVDLIAWPLVNDREESDYDATHLYYSVLAIDAALENKDEAFVKQLIDEIRVTQRKRTNMGSVYRAYKKIGGGNLKKIAQEITEAAEP